MRYPDQVSADLSRYEAEQDELERRFDPTDLSEVTQDEVKEAWDDMPMSRFCALTKAIRVEDWDQFAIEFREMLIEGRTDGC